MDYYDKLGDWNEETLCFLSVQVPQGQQKAKTDEQLYQAAVWDAVTIEDGEMQPLATIAAESDMVTWQDGKVLPCYC